MIATNFVPISGSRDRRLVAAYRNPDTPRERRVTVHGWLTVIGRDEREHVVPAVFGPTGELVAAPTLAQDGEELFYEEEPC